MHAVVYGLFVIFVVLSFNPSNQPILVSLMGITIIALGTIVDKLDKIIKEIGKK